jgi:uncharacterized protein (DUF1697 family)
MITHVALLRAINVGGHGQVAMSDLVGLFTALGFTNVRSLLQTGNVVFRSDTQTGADLESLLEAEAAKRPDLHTDFLARTAEEWKAIVAGNPFPDEAEQDPAHLLVMLLKSAPGEKEVEALRAAITGPEIVEANGKHAYIVYPAGVGRSRLTSALIEKKLATRGTGRNWNTVLKLAAPAES